MKTLSIIDLIASNWSLIIEGISKTLLLAVLGTIFGFFLALVIGPAASVHHLDQDRQLKGVTKQVISGISKAYISLFRGTPMVVQAMIIFYSLSMAFGRVWFIEQPIYLGIFIISINTAAYIGEVIRGALINIDQGQYEACRALGLKKRVMLKSVLLPQAIRHSLPAIGNELVVNIKDSSVLFLIQINELFAVGRSIAGKTYQYEVTYLMIALIYLGLTFFTNQLLQLISKKTDRRAWR